MRVVIKNSNYQTGANDLFSFRNPSRSKPRVEMLFSIVLFDANNLCRISLYLSQIKRSVIRARETNR